MIAVPLPSNTGVAVQVKVENGRVYLFRDDFPHTEDNVVCLLTIQPDPEPRGFVRIVHGVKEDGAVTWGPVRILWQFPDRAFTTNLYGMDWREADEAMLPHKLPEDEPRCFEAIRRNRELGFYDDM